MTEGKCVCGTAVFPITPTRNRQAGQDNAVKGCFARKGDFALSCPYDNLL